jgi:tetraacyldisaccharide 4'-kinase
MKAPGFWRDRGVLSTLLTPYSCIYTAAAKLWRARATAYRPPVPVICVGNLTAGGAGKTPVVLSLGARLHARGETVHFLSRGYGGRESGPLRVDPDRHGAGDVGDEPLLLARAAPSWIARDRAAGARAAVQAGASVIVLDDGHQNPTIAKDLSLLVVDGGYGFGNGRVFPAGPLREPLPAGFARADAAVLMEPDECGIAPTLPDALPLLRARLAPTEAQMLAGRPVVAFAGIGRPEKFFATLADMGCRIAATRGFADHHRFTAREIGELRALARDADATLVTTEKDFVRLSGALRDGICPVPVEVEWREAGTLEKLLERTFARD